MWSVTLKIYSSFVQTVSVPSKWYCFCYFCRFPVASFIFRVALHRIQHRPMAVTSIFKNIYSSVVSLSLYCTRHIRVCSTWNPGSHRMFPVFEADVERGSIQVNDWSIERSKTGNWTADESWKCLANLRSFPTLLFWFIDSSQYTTVAFTG